MLLQTLALAAAQVFATSLDTYFQLTIMLMVLVIGITVLAHYQPFEDSLSQSMQVSDAVACFYVLSTQCHALMLAVLIRTHGLLHAPLSSTASNFCLTPASPHVVRYVVYVTYPQQSVSGLSES